MKDVQGKCRFCGQYRAIRVPDSFNDIDIEEEVTKKCDCVDAVSYTKKQEHIANGEGAVKELFEEYEELVNIRDALLAQVKPLCENNIDGVSFKKGIYTCKMKRSKDGVKVDIESKTVDSLES